VTGLWDSERRALTIGLVATMTLIAFEGLAVATIMPSVRADLGGIRLYGWAFSAFFLTSLISTVLAGREADRRGVGAPFAIGVGLFTAGLMIAAAAPSMLVLVLGRAVQGLGAGAVAASSVTTIAREYPEDLRPRMFAVMSTAWVVPGMIGPAVSGFIADGVGWRWVFAGLLPLIAVAGGIAIPRIRKVGPPDAAAESAPTSDARTAVLLAASVGVLLAGLGESRAVLAVPLVLAGLAGAIPTLGRLLPPGALRARRGLPTAVVLKGVLTFAFFGTDAYISLAVTSVRHRSVTVAGLALTAATLTWTAGAWIHAQRAGSAPPRRFIALGLTFIGAGIVLVTVGLSAATPLAIIVAAWAVAGLGMGIAYQSVTLAVLAEAPPGQEGAASGAQQLTDLLGIATGTGVVGAVVALGAAAGWSRAGALRVGFAITLAMALIGIALTRRLAASGPDEPEATAAPRSTPSWG
jgi:MFS family permease